MQSDELHIVTPSPDVSVIIPVYNSARTLRRAIDSVLSQTLRTLELLIIDDGSQDDSASVAKDAIGGDPRASLLQLEQNGGKARVMNYAMGIAKGQWLAVLDADDRYLPARLATLIAAGTTHGVDLVADNQLHLDHASGRLVRQAFTATGAGREVGLSDFIAHSNPGATFDFGILKPMIRTSFARTHALFYHPGANLAEDFYYLLDFFTAGGRAWLVHEPMYAWTLPFSPTTRSWTGTGAGAWRYDYRNALETNAFFQAKTDANTPPEVTKLLRRRARAYRTMISYIDAQRYFSETKSLARPAAIIATHPDTWPLLARRVAGRLIRAARAA